MGCGVFYAAVRRDARYRHCLAPIRRQTAGQRRRHAWFFPAMRHALPPRQAAQCCHAEFVSPAHNRFAGFRESRCRKNRNRATKARPVGLGGRSASPWWMSHRPSVRCKAAAGESWLAHQAAGCRAGCRSDNDRRWFFPASANRYAPVPNRRFRRAAPSLRSCWSAAGAGRKTGRRHRRVCRPARNGRSPCPAENC